MNLERLHNELYTQQILFVYMIRSMSNFERNWYANIMESMVRFSTIYFDVFLQRIILSFSSLA